MKSHLKLFWVILVGLVVLAVLLLIGPRFRNAAPARIAQALVSSKGTLVSAPQVTDISTNGAGSTGANAALAKELEIEKGKLQEIRQVMEHDQVPLNFYGHVVDENGIGVSGATIKVTYTHFDLTVPQYWFRGDKGFTMESDAQGLFTIKGVKGYSLGLDVGKEGYFASTNNFRGAVYVHPARGYEFTPDTSKPVVFRLRKKSVAEPLIRRSEYYLLPRDGTPVFVDLVSGRTNSPTPDLKIQAWTDDSHKDAHFRYDWRARVEVIGGGAAECRDEFQYTAPEQGYETFFAWNYPQSRDDWRNKAEASYFVKLRNGEMYARVDFAMTAADAHFCTIESKLNPSGSRNLEPGSGLLFQDMDAYNRYMAKQKQATK